MIVDLDKTKSINAFDGIQIIVVILCYGFHICINISILQENTILFFFFCKSQPKISFAKKDAHLFSNIKFNNIN